MKRTLQMKNSNKFLREREREGLRETECVYKELVTIEVGPTRPGLSSATEVVVCELAATAMPQNLLGK